MSAPEILTPEMCFAAAPNAAAVRAIRDWCDKTEAATRAEPLRWSDSEAVFQARMDLVDEVRALLPVDDSPTT